MPVFKEKTYHHVLDLLPNSILVVEPYLTFSIHILHWFQFDDCSDDKAYSCVCLHLLCIIP